MTDNCTILYKILTPEEKKGMPAQAWKGSDLDLKDGFIHTSTSKQLPTTLDLFFGKESETGDDLFLCALPLKNLEGKEIRFEPAGCGHIYASIDPESDISETMSIQRQADTGKFQLGNLQF